MKRNTIDVASTQASCIRHNARNDFSPSPTGRFCKKCVGEIRYFVRVIPWLYEQCALKGATGNRHLISINSSEKRQSRTETGDHAIEARTNIEDILASWTAMVVDELGVTAPRLDVRSYAIFLDTHVTWLATHPSAGDLMQELEDLCRAAVPVIDRRERIMTKLGECVEDGCSAPLVADLDHSTSLSFTLVRCEFGHRWTARDWLRVMYRTADEDGATAERMVPTKSAARALGVSEATIRQWAHRGKLTRHGTPGNAAYDLAELAALACRLPAGT